MANKAYSEDFLETLNLAYRDAYEKGRIDFILYLLMIFKEIGVIHDEKTLDKSAKTATIKLEENMDASGQRAKGNWVTIRGTHVLVDKAGTIVKGPENLVGRSAAEAKSESSGKEKEKAKASAASATGANKPCTGFADRAAARRHRKHWKEVGVNSNAEYVDHANRLFVQRVGGDIDGYARPDGTVVRYNTKTGDYVAGKPGGPLYTHFKPKWRNGKTNLSKSLEYFHEEMKVKGSE